MVLWRIQGSDYNRVLYNKNTVFIKLLYKDAILAVVLTIVIKSCYC